MTHHVDHSIPSILSIPLCAGGGGLERGIEQALGAHLQPLVTVEREAFAAKYLDNQMATERMAPSPIYADLCRPPVELLDRLRRVALKRFVVLSAGFPCQPHSAAGGRKHEADERWIWPEIARWIRKVRPGIVVLENVPGLATGPPLLAFFYRLARRVTQGSLFEGFSPRKAWESREADVRLPAPLGHVLGTLAEEGYLAGWDVFRAAEAGAPHKRERLFVVGVLPNAHGQLVRLLAERGRDPAQPAEPWDLEPGDLGAQLADAGRGKRWPGSPATPAREDLPRPGNSGEELGDAHGQGLQDGSHGPHSRREIASDRRRQLAHAARGDRNKTQRRETKEGLHRAGFEELGDHGQRLQGGRTSPSTRGESALDGCQQLGDTHGEQPQRGWAGRQRANELATESGRDRVLPPFPPGPHDWTGWSAVLEAGGGTFSQPLPPESRPRLNLRFVAWVQGWLTPSERTACDSSATELCRNRQPSQSAQSSSRSAVAQGSSGGAGEAK